MKNTLMIPYLIESTCNDAVKMGGTAEAEAFRPKRDERLLTKNKLEGINEVLEREDGNY